MENKRNIIISAGGTGGHIIPAITIGLSLKSVSPVFTCGARDIEKTIYKSYGLNPVEFALGSFSPARYIISFPKNFMKAVKLIYDKNPSSVFVAGNYTSGPMGLAAVMMNKKLLAIEQDALIGKANRIFSLFAHKIFTAYKPPFRHIDNSKAVFIGHVLRSDIRKPVKQNGDIDVNTNRKKILIIGGSQGALSMTKKIIEILYETNKYHLIVVAGKSYDKFEKRSEMTILSFYKNMGWLYSLADIIIARSGALSVAEIAFTNKPALFVPLSSASNDEQKMNILSLIRKNKQFDFISEKSLTRESLIKKLNRIENMRGENMHNEEMFSNQIETIERYV
ncbi:MAG: glycosyltransferase [bacterium]